MADQTNLQKIEARGAFDPRLTFEERVKAEQEYGRACEEPEAVGREIVALRRDVVKLARALSDIMEDSRGCDAPINRGLNSIQNAERVLREVAGGE